jgi:PKD repeat protein
VRRGTNELLVIWQLAPGQESVQGVVSNASFTSTLFGWRAGFDAGNAPTNFLGQFNVIFSGGIDPSTSPFGFGYANLRVSRSGKVTIKGRLADSTSVAQIVPFSTLGQVPLHRALYAGRGSIFGWLSLQNNSTTDVQAHEVWWTKTSAAGGKLYRDGFTNQVYVLGSHYLPPPPGTRILNFSNAILRLEAGNLPAPVTNYATLNNRNQITATEASPNRLNASIRLPTGLLRGSFDNSAIGRQSAIRGVFLPRQNVAAGFFVGTNQSGSVSLGQASELNSLLIGPLNVAVNASYIYVATGFTIDFRAQIDGRLSSSRWEFGDGTALTNQSCASHSWMAAGDYPVVLRAYNESYPLGVTATVIIHVVESPVHYVALNSSSPSPPYSSWDTAASSIQNAVDAAAPGALVLVNDGIYESGGRAVYGIMTNRVAVTKPLTVRSVNGPGVTVIRGHAIPVETGNGDGAVRGMYLANGAMLIGFTITNGHTLTGPSIDIDYQKYGLSGGGVWCESTSAILSNCIVTHNGANGSAGGINSGTLNHCTIVRNWAGDDGGGANGSVLNNCILTRNFSYNCGGGARGSVLNSCVLMENSANEDGGGAFGCTLNNCIISMNSALYEGEYYGSGGGAALSTLNNCVLTGNSASTGGGAYGGMLANCTLVGNLAGDGGGGAASCTLNNCIAYYNTTFRGIGANYAGVTVNYSCTTPLPATGAGNISSAPLFANQATGEFRLQADSPCINAGNNAYAPAGPDLDGLPRIVGGTVDIGAYEFQTP